MKLTTPTKFLRWVAVAAITGFALLPVTGRADDQAELIQKLLNRIEQLEKKVNALEAGPVTPATSVPPTNTDAVAIQELDQKVKVLERNRELDAEAAEAKAKEAPKITIGDRGFGVASASGDFSLQLKGVLQVDSRRYFDDGDIVGNDGFLVRRARPILQGTLYRDFDFLFVPDFGGSSPQIFDAYVNYRYQPWLQLRAGKFKTPIGLEQLQSDVNTLFNERSLVTDLVPNRDIGCQLWGDIAGGVVSYQAAMLDGVGDARNNTINAGFNDSPEFAGRLFALPFKNTELKGLQGLGIGVAGSYGFVSSNNPAGLPGTTGGTLPGYATVGQQQFFAYNPPVGTVVADGNHWRFSPQAYYYYGPLGLMAEYAISNQRVTRTGTLVVPALSENLQNTAWQVAASWVLTGEDASFNGVVPQRPFDLANGQWGAFQIVGRYTALDIDDDAFPIFSNPNFSASSASGWSAGINWYLNRNVRLNASYSYTTFTGGGGAGIGGGTVAPAIVARQPEQVLFTRIQLSF
jgi:phosphate-selective porin OprO/OprP